MTSTVFFYNQTANGHLVNLTKSNDSATVIAGVTINSADASDSEGATAIFGTASYHTVTVDGSALGASYGVYLGDDPSSDNHQRVTVAKDGKVFGFGEYGVSLIGNSSQLANKGAIFGNVYGVYLYASSPANVVTTTKVTNSGTIEARQIAVLAYGTEKVAIANTGTINGDNYSFYDIGGGDQTITNKGVMVGDVLLGYGDDIYDGRGGHVQGEVFGGDGADKLYGGTEGNRLSGGYADDDLFGGKGKDTFIFDAALSKKDNVDTISDFSHADDTFELHNGYFSGLKKGTLSSSAFKEISSGSSTTGVDSSDRILFDKKHGDLYFDQDGSKTDHSRILFAHVSDNTGLTYSDFKVVNDVL